MLLHISGRVFEAIILRIFWEIHRETGRTTFAIFCSRGDHERITLCIPGNLLPTTVSPGGVSVKKDTPEHRWAVQVLHINKRELKTNTNQQLEHKHGFGLNVNLPELGRNHTPVWLVSITTLDIQHSVITGGHSYSKSYRTTCKTVNYSSFLQVSS